MSKLIKKDPVNGDEANSILALVDTYWMKRLREVHTSLDESANCQCCVSAVVQGTLKGLETVNVDEMSVDSLRDFVDNIATRAVLSKMTGIIKYEAERLGIDVKVVWGETE